MLYEAARSKLSADLPTGAGVATKDYGYISIAPT